MQKYKTIYLQVLGFSDIDPTILHYITWHDMNQIKLQFYAGIPRETGCT